MLCKKNEVFQPLQQQQLRAMQRKGLGNKIDPWKGSTAGAVDLTLFLGDEVLLRILGLLPFAPYPYSQVCKRWLKLQGLIRKSIKVLDWKFLESGRMSYRFPNLVDIDLTPACLSAMPKSPSSIEVLFTHRGLTVHLGADAYDPLSIKRFIQNQQLPPSTLDKGLTILADAWLDLQRLCVVDVRKPPSCMEIGSAAQDSLFTDNVSSDPKLGLKHPSLKHLGSNPKQNGHPHSDCLSTIEPREEDNGSKTVNHTSHHDNGESTGHGLSYIAQKCHTLQELELHQCTDESLHAISACKNLQIVRLVGSVSDFYHCLFTDIGLTILARSCDRLVKLDLSGCEASYDGIAALGQCCIMLEELTLSNHGFHDGWIAALPFCTCLKTLRLENRKHIDPAPGPLEHLGYCMALEHLQLVRCDLRDVAGFHALMMVSMYIRELELQDCWGLDDETFSWAAATCRRLKLLSLERCSPLTTLGLEIVVSAYKELQGLRVVYCNHIKDSEISPDLALQFCTLKELKWRPDAKSLISMSLTGTGIGQHGGKFFKKGGS